MKHTITYSLILVCAVALGAGIHMLYVRYDVDKISGEGANMTFNDNIFELAKQKSVEEFRSGKEKAFNALVGQIMKASQGKANPGQVNELLLYRL